MVVANRVGREHIPGHPRVFVVVRFLQLVLGLAALGLDAYGLSLLPFSGSALSMFTCVANLIVCIYIIVASLAAPRLYNYWAVLALDVLMVVFWLASFALMASQIAPLFKGYRYCNYYGRCYTYHLEGADLVFAVCMAAVAGLGGVEFVLYLIALAIGSLYLCRHRKNGGHSRAGAAAGPGAEKPLAGGPVPLQQQQVQPQQTPPVYAQQQQGHPAGQTMTPPPVQQQQQQQEAAQPAPYYPQQTPSPLYTQSQSQSPPPPQQQQQQQYHEVSGAQPGQYYPQQHQQHQAQQ